MRRFMAIFLLLPLLPAFPETKTQVFAPFVTRLQAQAQESSILLTWKESRDVQGPRNIYRYSEEINQDNFPEAVYLGQVPANVNAYEDLPSGREAYFYAVLLEDSDGKVFEVFIPFRNITSRGVAVQTLPPEELIAAEVSKIGARVEGDAVVVSFEVSKPDRELLLFRSVNALRSSRDLLSAEHPVVLEKNTTSFRDFPIPGVEAYYAVVDAGLYKIGKAVLVPGVNSLTAPVLLPAGGGRVGLPAAGPELRPTPLPYLLLAAGVESGQELSAAPSFLLPRDRRTLSPQSAAALAGLLAGLPAPEPPARRIELLAADRPSGGAGTELPGEAVLRAILAEHLTRGEYQRAADQLSSLLRLERPQSLEQRARFYLGQAFYFLGRYREAFFEFLAVREALPRDAQPWLDACLLMLGRSGS